VAGQVNRLGPMNAVIHNAGVISGPHVLPVNVVAPYLLTALIEGPQRLIYLSSSMHRGGRARITSDDPEARTSGGYWYHQRRAEPAPAVHDQRFQDELLESLARFTATPLPNGKCGARTIAT
jgi:hypothetical protein